MACNCGKKNNQPRRTATVPRQARIVSAQSARPQNPAQIQALAVTTTDGLNASRRTVERKRREAIFRKLGRM
jgi:hypothetical protein